MTNNKYLIEVLKKDRWMVVGASKTMEAAEKRAATVMKSSKGQSFRITIRDTQK